MYTAIATIMMMTITTMAIITSAARPPVGSGVGLAVGVMVGEGVIVGVSVGCSVGVTVGDAVMLGVAVATVAETAISSELTVKNMLL